MYGINTAHNAANSYAAQNTYNTYSTQAQSSETRRTSRAANTSEEAANPAVKPGSSVDISVEGRTLAADRATTDDIIKYRDKLQAEEAAKYREDLVKFGLSADAKFEILSDGKGGYTIKADYRDKPFLEAYFRENPDSVSAFMKQDKLTAQDVLTYRDGLQAEFDATLAEDLKALGIDENTPYEVKPDGKGGVTIKADAETQAILEKYFKDNPDMVKTLTKIGTAMDVDLSKGQGSTTKPTTPDSKPNDGVLGNLDTAADKANRKQINQLATFLLMQSGANNGFSPLETSNYKKDLQAQFEAQMKSDLKKLGVDEDIKFTLRADKQGNITVLTDSKDKAIIEKYLKDNPEMTSAFIKMEKVSGATSTPQSQRFDAQAVRQRIQLESMNAWFMGVGSSGIGGGSAAADFLGTDISQISRLNRTV